MYVQDELNYTKTAAQQPTTHVKTDKGTQETALRDARSQ